MRHRHIDDLCADRRIGVRRLSEIVAEDIAGGAVKLDLIPAVVRAENGDELTGRDLRNALTVRARTGAYVDRAADDDALRKFGLGGNDLMNSILRRSGLLNGGFLLHCGGDVRRAVYKVGNVAVCRVCRLRRCADRRQKSACKRKGFHS